MPSPVTLPYCRALRGTASRFGISRYAFASPRWAYCNVPGIVSFHSQRVCRVEGATLRPENWAASCARHIKPDIPASVPGDKKGNEYEKSTGTVRWFRPIASGVKARRPTIKRQRHMPHFSAEGAGLTPTPPAKKEVLRKLYVPE